jgi:hypothetical protein
VAKGESQFIEWGGACSGAGACEVTVSEAKEVIATFRALPQAIAKPPHPIAYTEATLRGEIQTAELETEYRFEYLTEAEYEEDGESFEGAQKTPMVELEPAKAPVAVEAPLVGLQEGTAYRFRLRAMSSAGPAEDEGSFETLERRHVPPCLNGEYRFGLSANLPDCRAYELVTPAQTDGLAPYAANSGGTPSGLFSNSLTVPRGEGAGERLSYFTDGTLPGFEGNGRFDGYRAERGADDHPVDGWQSTLFSPNYVQSAPGTLLLPSQHGVAPDQLYSFWEIKPEPETFPQTLPEGVYLSTPSGFEVLGQGSLGEDLGVRSRYVSAGGSNAIFVSGGHLEEKAAPKGTDAIYDRVAGKASATVISVKPDGSPFGAGEGAIYIGSSESGSAVAFSVGGVLYLHREGATIEIATAPNTFAGISEDGKRVFFAATADGASPGSLFACDIEAGPCAGSGAVPPTKIVTSGIFAGISPDGSLAFFISTEALTGGEENDNEEKAQSGARNLYAWNGTETSFIGRLSGVDLEKSAFGGPSEANLAAWTRAVGFEPGAQSGRALAPTRSTPDGSVFVFQSHARLTDYDNEGKGEIYRYDPEAGVGERLLCVSCDPSGSPASANALLVDIRTGANTPIDQSTTIANLTDDGEAVFFQSFDRLLPEDANEVEDVYEWEANGSGGCTRPAGCLGLISSGQGETPSFLYAMSADGHDVFLNTKEKLVGADVAGSPSIYDARRDGGIPEPAEPPPCQGDACQGQGSEPPVIPTPATMGSGENPQEPAVRVRHNCGKGKHRVKGRCARVKHRKHHRRHRANTSRGGNR